MIEWWETRGLTVELGVEDVGHQRKMKCKALENYSLERTDSVVALCFCTKGTYIKKKKKRPLLLP